MEHLQEKEYLYQVSNGKKAQMWQWNKMAQERKKKRGKWRRQK